MSRVPVMELTVPHLYDLLLRSRLLSPEEAKAVFARWQEEAKKDADRPDRFTSWLVAQKFLTDYQATLLARGHTDGFFLGEYQILDRLGKGRMAGVYKARHKLGQVVAIKVLPPSRARNPAFLGRFLREAKLSRRLKHPNIVRSFKVGKADRLYFIAMEYLEGETLEEVILRRGRLPPAEAVHVTYQALLGLEHIRSQGLVHRDLKPSNLMLLGVPGKAGDQPLLAPLKILDIGLGRALFEEGGGEPLRDKELTEEGMLLGTPDYLAPEQARDARSADIRSDIYSLGCVLYHLLAGQLPFPDTNLISQMIRHATEPARPLKEFNPAVADGLQQIVNWMMAKDPAARYPTPERAAQALQVFLTAGAPPPGNSPEADPGLRSYLGWLDEVNTHAALAKKEKKARSRSAESALPSPAPPAAVNVIPVADVTADLDVELVNVPTAADSPGPDKRSGLSRRDCAVFALGVLAGALATFLGCLVALFRRKPESPRQDSEPEPQEQ